MKKCCWTVVENSFSEFEFYFDRIIFRDKKLPEHSIFSSFLQAQDWKWVILFEFLTDIIYNYCKIKQFGDLKISIFRSFEPDFEQMFALYAF